MDTPVVLFGAFVATTSATYCSRTSRRRFARRAVPVHARPGGARPARVGGHRVETIDALMAGWARRQPGPAAARGRRDAEDYSTFEAAVMLLDAGELQPTLRRLESASAAARLAAAHAGDVPPAPLH